MVVNFEPVSDRHRKTMFVKRQKSAMPEIEISMRPSEGPALEN
jgi:hypothetical protein